MKIRKPKIIVSSCLIGEAVRYDGKVIKNQFVEKLKDYVELIPVCPEISIGLPVPRNRIILVRENESYKVYQPATNRDLTKKLKDFSERFLNEIKDIDGFLLKSKSPSCGVSGTKCYKDKSGKNFIGRRRGIFAIKVNEKFKNYPIEDELRLQYIFIKFDFLTRLYLIHFFKILDKGMFINRFKNLLELYNKKQTKEFISNPTFENLLRIFSRKLSEKTLNKKLKMKTLDLNKLKNKDLIIFPENLL